MQPPKVLLEKINQSSRFLAHVHLSPDPDTIGSALALKIALESQGKVVELFCEDEIPQLAAILPETDAIHHITLTEALATYPHDLYLAMDTPMYGLLTKAQPVPSFPKPVVVIDHHLDTAVKGQTLYIDSDASSTSEMVYRLIKRLGIELTSEIASCLLFGILGDTGVFQNLNTSSSTLKIASELVAKGASYQQSITQLQRSHRFEDLQSWGIMLSHLKISEDGEFVWIAISDEVWQTCNPATRGQTFSDLFLGRVVGTKFGALLVEKRPGRVNGSLRSRLPEVNVQQIAEKLNGGGHKNSSGFRLEKPLLEAERDFLNVVQSLKS